MVNFEVFLMGLLATSVLTGLVTEAIKKVMDEHNKTYRSNTLAGLVSVVLSAAIGAGYVVMAGVSLNSQLMVCLIALVLMSWLCAMVGYDKVIQAISQFKTTKEG